ncbi:MAG: FKBP-type peptidyl-prolyl cis-trans isomerase [Candidatus Bathyarchaeia archaeon]
MPIKKGDFALIDFTTKIKENSEIIETTLEKVAKEAKIHQSENIYEPMFIVVGEKEVPEGLDEALLNLEPDKEITVEVTPEKGYGPRDSSKMRLIPMKRFRNEQINPVPGARVQIDGKSALVRSVGAGRVQVDFNHPLAGKILIYDVKLQRIIETNDEKIKAILHRRLPMIPADKFKINLTQNECTMELPEDALFIEGLQLAKKAISNDIQKFLPETSTISFLEIFRKPRPASEEKPKEAEPPKDTTKTP